jgi:hypothetical protein
MKFTPLICISTMLMFAGCSSYNDQPASSDLTQIIPNYLTCDVDQERTEQVKSKYGRFFRGNGILAGYRATANIPDVLLSYVFQKRSTSIFLKGLGRGGFASSGGGRISIDSGVGSLAHELGHAVHFSYFRDKIPNFDNELRQAYSNSVRNERSGMRGYSTQNYSEFLADLFDSYYCSEQSRNNVKTRFPRAFAFAEKFFPTPPSEVIEQDPNADDDNDGVINSEDFCSNTPIGEKIWKDGEFIGCAGGQTPDK